MGKGKNSISFLDEDRWHELTEIARRARSCGVCNFGDFGVGKTKETSGPVFLEEW